jgi:hypothetical protein
MRLLPHCQCACLCHSRGHNLKGGACGGSRHAWVKDTYYTSKRDRLLY